jgi:hypothetical protein
MLCGPGRSGVGGLGIDRSHWRGRLAESATPQRRRCSYNFTPTDQGGVKKRVMRAPDQWKARFLFGEQLGRVLIYLKK